MKNKYIIQIEKTAGIKDKATKLLLKHKNKLMTAGVGAGALGAAYGVSGDENKKKIKDGVRFVKNGVKAGVVNGKIQDAAKYSAGALGTAVAMKRGKSFKEAIKGAGMAGVALGDIAGSATIPTVQLYKKHKKEFGTAPDAKTLGAVMAGNVLPTAGVWGGLYGAKKGIALRKNISNGLVDGASGVISNSKKLKGHISEGFGNTGAHGTSRLRDRLSFNKSRRESAMKIKNMNRVDFLEKEDPKSYLDKLNKPGKAAVKSLGKTMGAFAPVAFADTVTEVPAALVAPQNMIDIKKKRLKEKNNEN